MVAIIKSVILEEEVHCSMGGGQDFGGFNGSCNFIGNYERIFSNRITILDGPIVFLKGWSMGKVEYVFEYIVLRK